VQRTLRLRNSAHTSYTYPLAIDCEHEIEAAPVTDISNSFYWRVLCPSVRWRNRKGNRLVVGSILL